MHYEIIVECLNKNFKNGGPVQSVKLLVHEEENPINYSYMLYYFIYFTLLIFFMIYLKDPYLIKNMMIHENLPYQQEFQVKS